MRRDATPFARRHHANGRVSFVRAEQSSARNATIATAVCTYVRRNSRPENIKKKKKKKKRKRKKRKRNAARGTRDWTRDARSDAVINNSATRCRREFSGVDSTEKNSDSPGGKKATGENGSLKKKKEKKKKEKEKKGKKNGRMHPA